MIIANFTPDPISWTHIGVHGVIKSGEVKDMDNNRAKFILNKFDKKGLLQLQYGDVPANMKVKAYDQWRKFWEYQITVFNQDNQKRENTNREYVFPSEELKAKSTELNIQLIGPWVVNPTNDSDEVTRLKAENAQFLVNQNSLMEQMASMQKMMAKLTKNLPDEMQAKIGEELGNPHDDTVDPIEKPKAPEAEKSDREVIDSIELEPLKDAIKDPKVQEQLKEFYRMQKGDFIEWVYANTDRISNKNEFLPATIRAIVDKWHRSTSTEEPFPTPVDVTMYA